MKIVIIKSSPHKKGSSNLLAEQFARGAREAGHTIVVIDAAHMNIHPCLGCEYCGMNGVFYHFLYHSLTRQVPLLPIRSFLTIL